VYFSGFYVLTWEDRDRKLAGLRTFISSQSTNPAGQIRAQNFEWFLTQFLEPRLDVQDNRLAISLFLLLGGPRLIEELRKRNGKRRSLLEKAVYELERRRIGPWIFLALRLIYVLFRLLIIVLSVTSLRAMSDSLYDTTWAKNIPSVQ
jgi:hypothetical protein